MTIPAIKTFRDEEPSAALGGTSGSVDVDWALGVLFGHVPGATLGSGPVTAGSTEIASFIALPSLARPRLLVPANDRTAASSALRQYNQGMTTLARSRKAAGAVAAAAGVLRVAGRRIWVTAPSADAPAPVLERAIAIELGLDEVRLAAFIGSVPNRKPVLQLTRPGGEVVGYAKVAWNPLTSRLVATEASALHELNRRPVPGMSVPTVLAELEWQGYPVVVISAGEHRRRRRGPAGLRPGPGLVAALAEAAPSVRLPLADVPFVGELRARIVALPVRLREQAAAAIRRIDERFGDGRVTTGRWHGDLSPWNMQRTRAGWFVWDWERSALGVPVGMDSVHHAFQWSSHLTDGDAGAATAAALWEASVSLPQLGQPDGMERAFVGLSLLELLLRFEEGARAGLAVDAAHSARLAAALVRCVGAG
jgi:hypothetical protein